MKFFKFMSWSFFLVILVATCLKDVEGMKLQGYNEPCELYDETSTCDDKAGLICIDAGVKGFRCKCPNDPQFATLYDAKRNQCVGKVFNNCVHNHGPSNETYCTDNAECTRGLYYFPICVCKKGYFETEKGTCAPVSKYSEPCDDDKQCDSKYGMECADGVCKCKFGDNQYYDALGERCISYAGGNCSSENICVENAECTKTLMTRGGFDSRTVVFSYNGKKGIVTKGPLPMGMNVDLRDMGQMCRCVNGYSQTKEGRCRKTYGSVCSMKNESEKCNSEQFLECLDGNDGQFRCQCRNPFNERWSESKRQCVSLIGMNCRSSGPSCEDRSECSKGICQCAPGTSMSPYQTCLLDLNQKCRPGQCNLHMGLTCEASSETCQCIDSYLIYNKKTRACVATENSPCGKIGVFGSQRSDGFASAIDGPFIGCTDNSTCETKLHGRKMQNVCVPNRDLNKM